MTRAAPHAFAQAENRIDRGKTKERRQQQAEFFAALAKTTADGVLGGFSPENQPEVIDAMLREFATRRKAASDGPAAGAVLGAICHTLNADIAGGRTSARDAAERVFRGEG